MAVPASLLGHPLHAACYLGAEGEVRALVQAGADCDVARGAVSQTPTIVAT